MKPTLSVQLRRSHAALPEGHEATLLALHLQPGEKVLSGDPIGLMGNLDLDERVAQLRTEMARANADAARLTGELRVEEESASGARFRLAQRRRELGELISEQEQIGSRPSLLEKANLITASYASTPGEVLPAALAVLQAEFEDLSTKAAQAKRELERERALYADRLVSRSQLEAAESKSAEGAFNMDASRERLRAALNEHQRRQKTAETELYVTQSSAAGTQAESAKLNLELAGTRQLGASLEEQLRMLERKRAKFVLLAPMGGTVFGADLSRARGRYFAKGTEICRIADIRELQVRLRVPEQFVGDIAVGDSVRVKTRAYPDPIFQGSVSKIGNESELDPNGQQAYPVELTIRNENALLQPGMTVFARVEFGRHMVAWLLVHKLKQALRPETWMF